MKVLLILVDGMRPDSLEGISCVESLKKKASYSLNAKTVCTSDTLPCHMSLFHSVDPSVHGTLTNTYTPPANPVTGLLELLRKHGKKSAMFYSWEQLRDVARPGSLAHSYFYSCKDHDGEDYVSACTVAAWEYIMRKEPDFTFLYLAMPDDIGHKQGWMSDAYLWSVALCWDNIERILNRLPEDYTVIITADHGGHDKTHGSADPQDIHIPLFLLGKDFAPGKDLSGATIKDIAPTVASLLGLDIPSSWEGKSLL